MKYCSYCGAQVHDEAIVCTNCGYNVTTLVPVPVVQPAPASSSSTSNGLATVIKVFLIISCVVQGFFLIPLAWCLPMTISICNALKAGRPVSTAMKICTLLFVNTIAGICLLCMGNN